MHNPNIGDINCPFCGQKSYIRRFKKGSRRLYFVCEPSGDNPGCGHIKPSLAGGQEWILNNGNIWAGGEEPQPASPPEATPETEGTEHGFERGDTGVDLVIGNPVGHDNSVAGGESVGDADVDDPTPEKKRRSFFDFSEF